MAINYGANYTGIDKERYDAGNQFYSQDRFLQGTGLDKPAITFNPSRSNTGIMSQYPGGKLLKYPIIPQYGGDGGGPPLGPRGNSKFDYEYEALGGLNNPNNVALTEEEEKTLNMQKAKDAAKMAGKLGMFALNPMGYLMGKGISKGIGFLKDKFFGGNDGDGGGDGPNINPGTFTKESIDQSFAGEEGPTGGQTASSGTVDTGNFEQDGTGRQGYRDGGYSSEDNEEQQAQDQASFDAGNRTDDYTDMYSGDGGNPPPFYSTNEPTNTPNLDFSLVKDVNPAFSYANNFGKFGGVLDTTRTIQEEEPVGTVGYFSPSNNFGIGFDTDLGMVGKANLGNLNIGYTGQGGVNASYMDDFAGGAGRFGVNYGKDGLNLGLRFEKNFNNGGIVGLYR